MLFHTYEQLSPAGRRVVKVMIAALSIVALGISGYLSFVTISKGTTPVGCGAGSGCADVLTSKWSRLGGVPVSLFAAGIYVVVLSALPASTSDKPARQKWSSNLLAMAALTIACSAGWFIYLQLQVIEAVCPYCMAGHIIGLMLAALIVFQVGHRPVGGVLGLACAGLLIAIQYNTPATLTTVDHFDTTHDADTVIDGRRTVAVLDGRLVLHLDEEPLIGNPDAQRSLVMMLDYACLHCRHTHGVIKQVLEDRPDWLTVVLLPTPMNQKCNPHAPKEMDTRFDESCELAKTALAVFLADPSAFPAFDDWMYEPQAPRLADEARDEAVRLIGRQAYEQAIDDPRMQQMIGRNVKAYGQSGADRVPVLLMPGRAPAVGRVDNADLLLKLLDRPSSDVSQ